MMVEAVEEQNCSLHGIQKQKGETQEGIKARDIFQDTPPVT
jgi:hypothetical protein